MDDVTTKKYFIVRSITVIINSVEIKKKRLKFYAMHFVLHNRAIRSVFLLHFRPKRHKNDVI